MNPLSIITNIINAISWANGTGQITGLVMKNTLLAVATWVSTYFVALPSGGTMPPGDITIASGTAGAIQDSTRYGVNGGISISGGTVPTYNSCYWNDVEGCTTENARIRERLFVGNAVLLKDIRGGGHNAVVNTWLDSRNVPPDAYWEARDAQLVSMTDIGSIGVAGLSQSSQGDSFGTGGTKPAPVGVAAYTLDDTSLANQAAWGFYSEVTYAPVGVVGLAFGMEVDVRNATANNITSNPYNVGQGDFALWVAAGAGAGALNPSNTGIVLTSNSQTFNVGMNFKDGSLTKDGSGNSIAIQMGQGATIDWYSSNNHIGSAIRGAVSSTGHDVTQLFSNDKVEWDGTGAAQILTVSHVGSNTVQIQDGVSNIILPSVGSFSNPTILFSGCATACGIYTGGSNELDITTNNNKMAAFLQHGIRIVAVTIAGLDICSSGNIGEIAFVNDTVGSGAPTFGGTVTGGGATTVQRLVMCNGSNWTY